MTQRLNDYRIDHRVMVVEPTLAMFTIAKEIAALQARYAELEARYAELEARYQKLEEVEQRRQFRAFKEAIRSKATNDTYDAIEHGPR